MDFIYVDYYSLKLNENSAIPSFKTHFLSGSL